MQHAIARQAEAERERRAKIINAEGEFQAAAKLAEAADVIGRNPTTLQLRYLQTLREIGATQNSTVVFPLDLVKPVVDAIAAQTAQPATSLQTSPRSRLAQSGTPDGLTLRRFLDRGSRTQTGCRSSRRSSRPASDGRWSWSTPSKAWSQLASGSGRAA